MSTAYEIPLTPSAQQFVIALAGVAYTVNLYWLVPASCWVIDLLDSTGLNPILTGVPLVCGSDLFEQYQYLNLGGKLVAQTDGDLYAAPTLTNLGATGHLYFVVSS